MYIFAFCSNNVYPFDNYTDGRCNYLVPKYLYSEYTGQFKRFYFYSNGHYFLCVKFEYDLYVYVTVLKCRLLLT